jgi:hypothetical protein|tara:strand:+ start:42 stop:554 length:513 start_codon:yes stop_codon:yes gene_type:complete
MNKESKNFHYLEQHKDLMFTPLNIASDIISKIDIKADDKVLDGFKGGGAFYDQLPLCRKYYCETDEKIDFFDWDNRVDWVVSNPPFKILRDGQPINALILIINHCINISNKGFGLLINHTLWNALTVKRLHSWKSKNFNITYIKVYEIKKWFGRYYFVLFEKNKEGILDF